MTAEEYAEYLADREAAGLRIDPENAEVIMIHRYCGDPYGVCPDLPDEMKVAGREYFARSPGSDGWVWYADLPDATLRKMAKRFGLDFGSAANAEAEDRIPF